METNKKDKNIAKDAVPVGADFFDRLWDESWTYMQTVLDIVREPMLVLDKDLRVMSANEPFYRIFHVEPGETEKKLVYELGNGQWDIPALRRLLENILPKHTFFKGFEVSHDFPSVGHKAMILNARQIHPKVEAARKPFHPIILLAMEDVTEMMAVAETISDHAKQLETKLVERTQKLGIHIGRLERELNALKKQ